MVLTEHSTEKLTLAMELLDKAGLKPAIDSVLEFNQQGVEEGYKKLKSRRVQGKLVVKVSSPEKGNSD